MSNVRGLQFNQTSYNSAPKDPALVVPLGSLLQLYKATIVNGTGGAIAMGILRKLTDVQQCCDRPPVGYAGGGVP